MLSVDETPWLHISPSRVGNARVSGAFQDAADGAAQSSAGVQAACVRVRVPEGRRGAERMREAQRGRRRGRAVQRLRPVRSGSKDDRR